MTTHKIGPDYDPTTDEVIYDSKGNPITQDYIDTLAAEAETGYDLESLTPVKFGRPSLSRTGDSPQIRFRISSETRAKATQLAEHEGKTLSELARAALDD